MTWSRTSGASRRDPRGMVHASYQYLNYHATSLHGRPDAETNRTFVFLTNNFALPALTIAELYRCRWQVELFFKWIKQHLPIKSFYGTTENAVKTQIWTAVSVYVRVAIIKKRLKLDARLYKTLLILSVTVFERTPLFQLLTDSNSLSQDSESLNQLTLFD